MKDRIEFEEENDVYKITEPLKAALLMTLGFKLLKIVHSKTIYFLFENTSDTHNVMTLFGKNYAYVVDEAERVRNIDRTKKRESTSVKSGAKRIFKQSTRKIKGAARKGADGKWHG